MAARLRPALAESDPAYGGVRLETPSGSQLLLFPPGTTFDRAGGIILVSGDIAISLGSDVDVTGGEIRVDVDDPACASFTPFIAVAPSFIWS